MTSPVEHPSFHASSGSVDSVAQRFTLLRRSVTTKRTGRAFCLAGFVAPIVSLLVALPALAQTAAYSTGDQVLGLLRDYGDFDAFPASFETPKGLAAIIKPLAAETARTAAEVGVCITFTNPRDKRSKAGKMWVASEVERGGASYVLYGASCHDYQGKVHTHPPGSAAAFSASDFADLYDSFRERHVEMVAKDGHVCAMIKHTERLRNSSSLVAKARSGIAAIEALLGYSESWSRNDLLKRLWRGDAQAGRHYGFVLYCGEVDGRMRKVEPAPRQTRIEVLFVKAFVIMQKIAAHPEWPALDFPFNSQADPGFRRYLSGILKLKPEDQTWFDHEDDPIELLRGFNVSDTRIEDFNVSAGLTWPNLVYDKPGNYEVLDFRCLLDSDKALLCRIRAKVLRWAADGLLPKDMPTRTFAQYSEADSSEFIIEYPNLPRGDFGRGRPARGWGHWSDPELRYDGPYVDTTADGQGTVTFFHQSPSRFHILMDMGKEKSRMPLGD